MIDDLEQLYDSFVTLIDKVNKGIYQLNKDEEYSKILEPDIQTAVNYKRNGFCLCPLLY